MPGGARDGDGTQPGSFPSLNVSNHYEPNDRYHMNIRKRPARPRFPLECATACGFDCVARSQLVANKETHAAQSLRGTL